MRCALSASSSPSSAFTRAAAEAPSLIRITSARLSGTPAASRLDNRRVKFSSIRPEILFGLPGENLRQGKVFAGWSAVSGTAFRGLPLSSTFFAFPLRPSVRLIGRKPRPSICRNASCRPPASIWPSVTRPSLCSALYWKVGIESGHFRMGLPPDSPLFRRCRPANHSSWCPPLPWLSSRSTPPPPS